MATDAYDPNFSTSQSADAARARIEAEIDSLNRAFASTRSAAEELRDLAKALILKPTSAPEWSLDLAERYKKLDKADLVDELMRFLQCARLGAGGLGSPSEREGLQAVLSHVIYGLRILYKDLHPDHAEAEAA
jgi:hypothetical protein